MHLGELPRDGTGQIVGRYRLRHVRADFCASLGHVTFLDGVTTEPLEGFLLGRVMAGLGNDVDAEPVESAPAAPPVETAPTAAPSTPTTWSEIEALSEADVRAIAADLGCKDRRLGPPKLRHYIADELEIDRPGLPDGT